MEYTAQQAATAVTELYIGLYGRAPDPAGLEYWTDQLMSGAVSEEQIRANFVKEQPEWNDGLGALTNSQLVVEMYNFLFDRDPETAGLEYWTAELNSGAVNADQLVFALVNAATENGGVDRLTLDYKVEAAIYYAENYENSAGSWTKETGRESAAAAIDGVNDRESTDASKAATDAGNQSVVVLTPDSDTVVGTENDDTVQGQWGYDNDAIGARETFSAFDAIDLGGGDDTLSLAVVGNVDELPPGVSVTGVENLEINGASVYAELDEIDLGLIEGLETVSIDGLESVEVATLATESVRVGSENNPIDGRVDLKAVADEIDVTADYFVEIETTATINAWQRADDADRVAVGDITASSTQGSIEIYSSDADSITATAGDYVDIDSVGYLGAVAATAGDDVDIDVTGGMGSVAATAGDDVDIDSAGDVGSVDATAGDDIFIDVTGGASAGSITAVAGTDSFNDININVSDRVDEVDATAGGDIDIDASDAGTITADAGSRVDIDAGSGGIEVVVATAGEDVDIDSAGDVGSVDATASDNIFIDVTDGASAGSITAVADDNININVSDSVDEVDATAGGYIDIDASDAGTITAEAGGYIDIDASDAGTITADAGGYVDIDAGSGGIEVVVATAGTDVYIDSAGDVGSVDATASDDIGISALSADTIDATAGDEIDIFASDAGTITADAGGYVGIAVGTVDVVDATGGGAVIVGVSDAGSVTVEAEGYAGIIGFADGDIDIVDVTGEDVFVLNVGGDLGSVTATASDGSVIILATDGSIGDVTATAGGEGLFIGDGPSIIGDGFFICDSPSIIIGASDNIGQVSAIALDDVVIVAGENIAGVDAFSSDGSVSVSSFGGNIGNVTATVADGEDVSVAAPGGTIGDVDVSIRNSMGNGDAGLTIGVFGSDGVGAVSLDKGINDGNQDIDVRTNAGGAVDVAVAGALSDDAGTVSITVASWTSDADDAPDTLNLTLTGDTSDAVDVTIVGNPAVLLGPSDSAVELETVSLAGDSNAIINLEAISSTLSTVDGETATGDLTLLAQVLPTSDGAPAPDLSITTGSGDDAIALDYVNPTNGEQVHAALTVSTGAGDDVVGLQQTDDVNLFGDVTADLGEGNDVFIMDVVGATVTVDGGAGNDVIIVSSDSNNDVTTASAVSGLPLGDLSDGGLTLTIDAGEGDDLVAVSAADAAAAGSTIDLGTGTNTLYYGYDGSPSDSAFSDADTSAFDVTQGGNVTGSLTNLWLEADILVSSDVTLDIGGLGDISYLATAEIEITDSAEGSTLTIEGAASDFTLDVSQFDNGDDLGNSDDEDETDEDILRLGLNGVETLTVIASDEVGVVLDVADNADLVDITVDADNDDVNLVLIGLDKGGDVTTSGDDDQGVWLLGGDYGDVSVTSTGNPDDPTDGEYVEVTISAEVPDAAFAHSDADGVLSTTVGSITLVADDNDSAENANITIDGSADGIYQALDVSIGAVNVTAGEMDIEISDISDGTVNIGSLTAVLTQSDDGAVSELNIDDLVGSTVTVGDVMVTSTTSSTNGNQADFDLQIEYSSDSTVTLGDVTVNLAAASDGENVRFNDVDVDVSYLTDSAVDIGALALTVGGSSSKIDVEFDDLDSTNVSVAGMTLSAEDINIDIEDNSLLANDEVGDRSSMSLTFGDITASDNTIGGNDGVSLDIDDNDDEGDLTFDNGDSLNILSIEIGDVTLSSVSDDASLSIGDNDGIYGGAEAFGSELAGVLGVQVDVGNVNLTAGSDGEASLDIDDNVFVDVNIGTVTAEGGDWDDDISYNCDSAITRLDTIVTLIGSDEFVYVEVDNNTDADITLGDYTVLAADSSDTAVEMNVCDNDGATVTLGDVKLESTNYVDLSVCDNDNATITLGDVTLEQLSTGGNTNDSNLYVCDNEGSTVTLGDVTILSQAGGIGFDVGYNNCDSTVTMGNVTLTAASDDAVNIDVSENTDGTVTMGNVTVVTGDYTDYIDYNDRSTITRLDTTVTLIGSDDSAVVTVYNNTDADITLGDYTVLAADSSDTSVEFYVCDNDGSTVTLGDVKLESTNFVNLYVCDNDNATITLGDVTLDQLSTGGDTGSIDIDLKGNYDSVVDMDNLTATNSAGDVTVYVYDNDNDAGSSDASVTMGNVTLTAMGDDSLATFELDDNDDTAITVGDLTLTAGGLAEVDLTDGYMSDTTIGNITLEGGSASVDVEVNNDDDWSELEFNLGETLDITINGDAGTDNVVTVDVEGISSGLETITVRGDDIDAIDITLGSLRDNVGAGTDGTSDTVVDTTLIDLSGVTGDTALINIDLTGEDEEAANLQDDMIIRLGDFSDGSTITTNVQDHGFIYSDGPGMSPDLVISDGDGVRQTYVFEGSDIGDITIEGFVAGRAFARDIDVGSDLVGGDDNGFANLTTDRIDLSAFGLTEEDVVVSYNSDDQSVTITAADGQFDGSIIVTGVGVDDGTGTKDDYEDRVLDSIIF